MGSTSHEGQHNPDETRSLDRISEVPAPPSLLPGIVQRLGLDGSIPPSLPLPSLLAGLNAPEWYWRAKALHLLAQQAYAVPLEPLLRALQDEHASVRIAAIEALSTQGSHIPVDRLLPTLDDPEWMVREAGILALERLGEHAPVAPLLNALHDQDATVREAARSVLQHTYPHLASATLPVSEVHPENVVKPAHPELHEARATEQQYATTNFFRSLFSSGKRSIQYRGTNMQNIVFDDYHHAESLSGKRHTHSTRAHGIGRNVAIGFAVIIVLANIVAWTVIAQKLHPSYPTRTGGNPNGTTQIVAPTHAPTKKPISKNIGKTLYSYQCQMDSIHSLAWFPNGKRIASTCFDAEAWDATTGKNVFTYEGNVNSSVLSVIVSPDGKHIAAASQNEPVWDTNDGVLLTTYQPAMAGTAQANPKAIMSGGNMIYDSAWSPDSTMIASSIDGNGYGYNVQVWNVSTGKHLFTLQSKPVTSASDYISQVVWSPDGKRIAFTIDQTVQIWDVATKHLLRTYPTGTFAWSPDGKYIASANGDGTIHVWNAQTGKTIYVYKGQTQEQGGVNALAWSPDGTRIASGGTDIHIWDVTTGKNVFIYKGHGSGQYLSINIIKWSPDGMMIASAAINGMNGGIGKVWIAD
jgi:uncharacterized protein with WD repeat